jgi:hypothetical protein
MINKQASTDVIPEADISNCLKVSQDKLTGTYRPHPATIMVPQAFQVRQHGPHADSALAYAPCSRLVGLHPSWVAASDVHRTWRLTLCRCRSAGVLT